MENQPSCILVIIDGFRSDAYSDKSCPNLALLRARGSSNFQARSVTPSITLPCHMSIFHSVPPSRHGILTNDWSPMENSLPGIVEIARTAGLKCAFFYNWEPLRNLSQPNNLDFSCFRNSCRQRKGDLPVVLEAVRHLSNDQFDFTFVYLGVLDWAGHSFGWMSDEYLQVLSDADEALGYLFAKLPENCTVLVHSDHGGHGFHHGTDMPEDMIVPWIIAGPKIKVGFEFNTPISIIDTAPTIANILGISPHSEWQGRCITEAFV